MSELLNRYRPWAMITGASYGIGEEFANQLAAMGFNLVLVARTEDMLKKVADRLIQEYKIEVQVVAVDLSKPDFLPELSEKTATIEIGLVISNAGSYNYGAFHKRDLEEMATFLRLNTNTHMQIAHYFGNKMKAAGRGGILLVSSMGAFTAIPYMANYAAAKAYVLSLGEALRLELREHGVDVMVLTPGTTQTPGTMNKSKVDNKKLGVAFMLPEAVVKEALKNFGKKTVCIPGGINKLSFHLGKRVFSRAGMSAMIGGIMKKALDPEIT